MKKLKCIIDKGMTNVIDKPLLDIDRNKIGKIIIYNPNNGEVVVQLSEKNFKKYKDSLDFYK